MAQLLLLGSDLSAGSVLEQALQLVEKRLSTWASSSNTDAFNALLLQVFEVQSSEATSALQTSLSGSGLGISLEILDGSTAAGINGAYTSADPTGAERIYLNADWLQNAAAAEIEAVLLEEIGHAIDNRLNGSADTPGDEGEIFSARLRGTTPASSAFSENDQRLIDLNGVAVAIEAAADTIAPTGSIVATAPAYAAAVTNPFGITDLPQQYGNNLVPAFADADADGDLDLFIGLYAPANTIFFRNTAAAGATAPAYAAPSTNPFGGITDVGDSASPSLADVDGDGDLDLFIGNGDGNTLFYKNTATPGASAPAYAAGVTNPFGISDVGFRANPAFMDADADGDLDLFISNRYGNTFFYRNTAAPGASAPAYAAAITNPFGISPAPATGDDFVSTAFTDVDADGDLDLFIGRADGNTLFLKNTAAAGATAPAYATGSINPFGISSVGVLSKPAFADADGDGDLDLFIGSGGASGKIFFFRNTAATPIAPVSSTTANGSYGIGAVISLTVQFSEAVLVTTTGGTPTLALETGSIDRYATYSSGSGTNTLSFT